MQENIFTLLHAHPAMLWQTAFRHQLLLVADEVEIGQVVKSILKDQVSDGLQNAVIF